MSAAVNEDVLFPIAMGAGAVALLAYLTTHRLRRVSGLSLRLDRFAPLAAESAHQPQNAIPARIRAVLKQLDPTHLRMEQNLQSVGISRGSALLIFSTIRLCCALAAAIGAGAYISKHSNSPLIILLSAACGLLLTLYGTNSILTLIVKDLKSRVLVEMFFAIDLLVIFLESGQSLDQSLHSLVELGNEATPRSIGTHRRLVSDLTRGIDHERAFALWSERLGVEEARDLSAFFVQSLVHGVELGPQLRRFAGEIMEKRLLNARARVGSKSARLTVIMVLFFLPAILIVLAGPPVVALMRHLGSMQ